MPIPISAQDVAEMILLVLVREIGLRAGQDIPDVLLKQKYRAHNYDAQDIPVGLEYACEREWLRYDSGRDVFQLTELGCEYSP